MIVVRLAHQEPKRAARPMFRRFRWCLAKRRLASRTWKIPPGHLQISREGHQDRVEDFPPNAEGYVRLASVWNDYFGWFVPEYGPFLLAAASYHGQPIKDVLDLACGTGLLTRRLHRWFEPVVGLDSSEEMLREARSQTRSAAVRYVQGDFRDFHLEETFDAAVCSGDALNYVQTPGELADVFRCVGRCLCPGGLFAFDVLDHQAFQALAGAKTVTDVAGVQFVYYSFYDADRRVNEARVIFPGLIERHRRVPIEPEDVRRSCAEAGFEVAEAFSTPTGLYLLEPFAYRRRFYVLRKDKRS
jgi:SAM-dependent methyltransferase